MATRRGWTGTWPCVSLWCPYDCCRLPVDGHRHDGAKRRVCSSRVLSAWRSNSPLKGHSGQPVAWLSLSVCSARFQFDSFLLEATGWPTGPRESEAQLSHVDGTRGRRGIRWARVQRGRGLPALPSKGGFILPAIFPPLVPSVRVPRALRSTDFLNGCAGAAGLAGRAFGLRRARRLLCRKRGLSSRR